MLDDQQSRIAVNIDDSLSLEAFVRTQYGMGMESYRELIRRSAVFQILLERCVRYRELTVRRLQVGVIAFNDPVQAEQARSKLARGANFEIMARDAATETSGDLGGVLPPLPADMDYPVIRDASGLAKGEISQVREAVLGKEKIYRIIKVMEILEPMEGSYAALKAQVEESLRKEPLVIPDLIEYWQESVESLYSVEYDLP